MNGHHSNAVAGPSTIRSPPPPPTLMKSSRCTTSQRVIRCQKTSHKTLGWQPPGPTFRPAIAPDFHTLSNEPGVIISTTQFCSEQTKIACTRND
ncbi:hypothetical protein NLJ89_g11961 [Agrocybe chaxingu]|uniref:Uncharacterized protein n=1 Tax=Agrocybe chaxingu TaxID=84603 RepID=A0A9W8JND8_9AGAR|nr:hypothetical protein NLJ89_g11961 [Agrocybe chaxingu]